MWNPRDRAKKTCGAVRFFSRGFCVLSGLYIFRPVALACEHRVSGDFFEGGKCSVAALVPVHLLDYNM